MSFSVRGVFDSARGLYRGPGVAKAFTNCRKIKRYSKDDKGRENVEDLTSKAKYHEEQQKKEE